MKGCKTIKRKEKEREKKDNNIYNNNIPSLLSLYSLLSLHSLHSLHTLHTYSFDCGKCVKCVRNVCLFTPPFFLHTSLKNKGNYPKNFNISKYFKGRYLSFNFNLLKGGGINPTEC